MRILVFFFSILLSVSLFGQQNPVMRSDASAFVEKRIKEMSIEEKIGQLLFFGFQGITAQSEALGLIKKFKPGGLILFGHNVRNPQQVSRLTYDIQSFAHSQKTPVYLAMDQEGGRVNRLKTGATVFPSAMALAATRSPELAYRQGRAVAQELRAVGVNTNLAPVLDVERNQKPSVIGVRSFSDSPALVTHMAGAYLKGLHEGNVLAIAKHYPGHGEVGEDSHFTTPVSQATVADLMSVDLFPYRYLSQSRLLTGVMTAHIIFPLIEPTRMPATVSPALIKGILRDQLHYNGLVVTDDLEMEGITKTMGAGEAAVRAIEAGADLLMVVWRPQNKKLVFDSLKAAVEAHRISIERLDESVRRHLSAKYQVGLFNKPTAPVSTLIRSRVGIATHRRLAETIARRAMTLLKNRDEAIPIEPSSDGKILVVSPLTSLGNGLASMYPGHVQTIHTTSNPSNEESEHVIKLIRKGRFETIVIGMYKPGHVRLLHEARKASQAKIVAVSFDTPFLLTNLDDLDAYLVTYTVVSPSPEVAGRVLAGDEVASGQIPVEWIKNDKEEPEAKPFF